MRVMKWSITMGEALPRKERGLEDATVILIMIANVGMDEKEIRIEREGHTETDRDRDRDRDCCRLGDEKDYGHDRERDWGQERQDWNGGEHWKRHMHAAAPVPEDRDGAEDNGTQEEIGHPDPEIAEANRVWASLGLKLLK